MTPPIKDTLEDCLQIIDGGMNTGNHLPALRQVKERIHAILEVAGAVDARALAGMTDGAREREKDPKLKKAQASLPAAQLSQLPNLKIPLAQGKEIILGRLSHFPSGLSLKNIGRSSDHAPKPADAIVWIEELVSDNLAEFIEGEGDDRKFRLTSAGRKWAAQYFAFGV